MEELTGYNSRTFFLYNSDGLYMSPQLLVKDVPRVLSCRHTVPCGLDKDEMFPVRIYIVKDKETVEVGSEMEIKVHKSASMCRLCLMLEELLELPHNSFYVYTSLAKLMNGGAPKYYKHKAFWFAFDSASQSHVVYVAMGLGAELDMFSPIPDSESDEENSD
jgi:hypothetical protein